MIFTQTVASALSCFTCLWEAKKKKNPTFIIFIIIKIFIIIINIYYFILSILPFGRTLLSKISSGREWVVGYQSPARGCPQCRHQELIRLPSPLFIHMGKRNFLARDFCDVFSHLLSDEVMSGDTFPSANAGRVRQTSLDVLWSSSSLPFHTTRGDFPSLLSNWLKRFFRNFLFLEHCSY